MADVVAADGKVAIIQPLPGVGDMVWHLPHIHALAEAQPEGAVAVVTKPRSRADQLFAADPAVSEVIWLDRSQDGKGGSHDGVLGVSMCCITAGAMPAPPGWPAFRSGSAMAWGGSAVSSIADRTCRSRCAAIIRSISLPPG